MQTTPLASYDAFFALLTLDRSNSIPTLEMRLKEPRLFQAWPKLFKNTTKIIPKWSYCSLSVDFKWNFAQQQHQSCCNPPYWYCIKNTNKRRSIHGIESHTL